MTGEPDVKAAGGSGTRPPPALATPRLILEPPRDRTGPRQGLIALALVLVLTVVAYGPSLGGEFVFDDGVMIVSNPAIGTHSALRTVLTESIWAHVFESNHYRPTLYLWLIAQHRCFGLDEPATGWRVTLLALHLIVVVLAYALGRKLGLRPLVVACGVMAFALHPQRVSSAGWISGANDPLMAIFGLGAMWFLLWTHEAKARSDASLRRTAALACFFLALLSKEPAVAIFGVLVAIDLFGPRVAAIPLRRRISGTAVSALPFLAALGVYLIMRFVALGYLAKHSSPHLTLGDAVMTLPALLTEYLTRAVVPYDLLLGPGFPAVTSPTDPRFAVGLLVTAGLLAATWHAARRTSCGETDSARRVLLALSWLPLLLLLDARNLPHDFLVQDRYLYLPAVGFSLLAAAGLARACDTAKVPVAMRWVGAVALALALTGLTAYEAGAWHDNDELYRRAVVAAPDSPAIHYGRGVVLNKAKDLTGATQAFARAIEIDPEYLLAWEGLGVTKLAAGDATGAAHAFERILELVPPRPNNPFYANGLLYLARARLNAGDPQGALAPAKRLNEIRGDRIARKLLAKVTKALE